MTEYLEVSNLPIQWLVLKYRIYLKKHHLTLRFAVDNLKVRVRNLPTRLTSSNENSSSAGDLCSPTHTPHKRKRQLGQLGNRHKYSWNQSLEGNGVKEGPSRSNEHSQRAHLYTTRQRERPIQYVSWHIRKYLHSAPWYCRRLKITGSHVLLSQDFCSPSLLFTLPSLHPVSFFLHLSLAQESAAGEYRGGVALNTPACENIPSNYGIYYPILAEQDPSSLCFLTTTPLLSCN